MAILNEHPIVQKLAECNLRLYLVGSRFMETHSVASDYDFYCEWGWTEKDRVEAVLHQMGFRTVFDQGQGYLDDPQVERLYRWSEKDQPNLPPVDVICLSENEIKHRLHCLGILKRSGGGVELAQALKGKGSAWNLLYRLMEP